MRSSASRARSRLAESAPIIVRRGGSFSGRVTQDWRERFIRAYDVEFAEWIDAIAAGGEFGPSSWDGYAAAVVSDAAVEALHGGQPGRRHAGRQARPVRLIPTTPATGASKMSTLHPILAPLGRVAVCGETVSTPASEARENR